MFQEGLKIKNFFQIFKESLKFRKNMRKRVTKIEKKYLPEVI